MASPSFNAASWLLDRHVTAGRGGRVAFRCGQEALTYAGLQRATWAAAHGFRSLGVGPGDRVLMLVSDELAFPAAFLAGLRIGAIPIPVSTMLRAGEVAVLVADSAAKVIVVSGRHAGVLADLCGPGSSVVAAVVTDDGGDGPEGSRVGPAGVPVHRWADFAVRFAAEAEVPPVSTTAESAGFWLYTSGTTGKPKAAIHRHGDVKAVCDTYGRSVLGIGPDDVCYSVPKLFFAFGLGNGLFFPLAVGASAVIDPEPPNPARAADLLASHRPTLFFAPPGFCAAMVDAALPGDVLSSVRTTVTAGETLPAEVLRRFTARFGTEMLDGIGSTEALHIFCSNHPGDVRPGWTGRPVAGYELRLLDESGAVITEADTPGSLWVRGDSVAAGYWQRPDLTASTFVGGWLRTGDVYQRSADGYYRFVGRNSDMIKAGGIWVSPAEVEGVLVEHPDVLEAAVVGGRNADGLEITVAFVVAGHGRTVDPVALDDHCRARMAAFKRPRETHVVSELPKTATGKIQRYALRAWLEGAASSPTRSDDKWASAHLQP
jgi:benzoate-CoA ligase family protein